MFALFSHIPYRIAHAITTRGGEPILVPAHPAEAAAKKRIEKQREDADDGGSFGKLPGISGLGFGWLPRQWEF